ARCTLRCQATSWCWKRRWKSQPEVRAIKKPANAGFFIGLPCSVGYTTLGQVIRRQLYFDFVTRQDTNVVLAHFSRDMRRYNMAVFQANTEGGVWQGVD